jgi:hypothetical protein
LRTKRIPEDMIPAQVQGIPRKRAYSGYQNSIMRSRARRRADQRTTTAKRKSSPKSEKR